MDHLFRHCIWSSFQTTTRFLNLNLWSSQIIPEIVCFIVFYCLPSMFQKTLFSLRLFLTFFIPRSVKDFESKIIYHSLRLDEFSVNWKSVDRCQGLSLIHLLFLFFSLKKRREFFLSYTFGVSVSAIVVGCLAADLSSNSIPTNLFSWYKDSVYI